MNFKTVALVQMYNIISAEPGAEVSKEKNI